MTLQLATCFDDLGGWKAILAVIGFFGTWFRIWWIQMDNEKRQLENKQQIAKLEAELKTVNAKAEFKHSHIFPETKLTLQSIVEQWIAIQRQIEYVRNHNDPTTLPIPQIMLIDEALNKLSAFMLTNRLYLPESLDKSTDLIWRLMSGKLKQVSIRFSTPKKGDEHFLKENEKFIQETTDKLNKEFDNAMREFRKQLGVLVMEQNKL